MSYIRNKQLTVLGNREVLARRTGRSLVAGIGFRWIRWTESPTWVACVYWRELRSEASRGKVIRSVRVGWRKTSQDRSSVHVCECNVSDRYTTPVREYILALKENPYTHRYACPSVTDNVLGCIVIQCLKEVVRESFFCYIGLRTRRKWFGNSSLVFFFLHNVSYITKEVTAIVMMCCFTPGTCCNTWKCCVFLIKTF